MVNRISGRLTFDQCRSNIRLHADNIAKDVSSSLINQKRIDSLRSLLNLFEKYNNKIIEEEKNLNLKKKE